LAIAESLPKLIRGVQGDERNVLLTLSRMWMTVSIGKIAPKDAAADWVLERLCEEHRALLKLAQRAYLGECKDDWGSRQKEVSALISHMKHAIEACLRSIKRDIKVGEHRARIEVRE
jgi:aminoglycoside 9-adenylyltransferase